MSESSHDARVHRAALKRQIAELEERLERPAKWQQKAEMKRTIEEVNDSMRKAGEQGWELVSFFYASSAYHIAYKRPIPDEPPSSD